jgi:hypothetical protein
MVTLEFWGKWIVDQRIRVLSVLQSKLIAGLIHLLCIRCKVIQIFWLSFSSELSTFQCRKWAWQLLSAIWSLGSEAIFWSHGPKPCRPMHRVTCKSNLEIGLNWFLTLWVTRAKFSKPGGRGTSWSKSISPIEEGEEVHKKYVVQSIWSTTKHQCNSRSVHVQYPETTHDMHYLHVLIPERLVINLS